MAVSQRLVRVVGNAIEEYLTKGTFGWGSFSIFGYSGEYGKGRAQKFEKDLHQMSDLAIMERVLEITQNSVNFSKCLCEHLAMCGIWYDLIINAKRQISDEKNVHPSVISFTEVIPQVIGEEVARLRKLRISNYSQDR